MARKKSVSRKAVRQERSVAAKLVSKNSAAFTVVVQETDQRTRNVMALALLIAVSSLLDMRMRKDLDLVFVKLEKEFPNTPAGRKKLERLFKKQQRT